MKTEILRAATIMLIAGVIAAHAQTDGSASFRVTTVTANGTYSPNHVLAIWVTDAQTNFVKTLEREAGTRIRYLYQWGAVSRSNVVDGITGATLGSHQTHNLTWNCRNTSGALVPDGVYRFWVEFSEYNGQGPWTATNVISFLKGASPVTNTPTSLANFNNMQVIYLPAAAGPVTLPGILQAEDYTTFYDTTVSNQGGQYRTDSVDIEVCGEGGYDVAWIATNEWLGFPVNVSTTGLYDIRARVASGNTGAKSLHVEVDGVNVTGPLSFNTGAAGWQVWTNAWASNVMLTAGTRQVRVVMDSDNFNLNYVAFSKSPVHDVAVSAIVAPAFIPPGAVTSIVIVVTNRGEFAESVNVTLTNATDRVLLGSGTASSLPAGARTNLSFTWNTATSSTGFHTLVASAGPVPGEALVADNAMTASVLVALGIVTNRPIVKGSAWRYSDEGLDLSATPWRLASYYDSHWDQGAGVLGFGNGGEVTTLADASPVANALPLNNASFENAGVGGAIKATNWNGESVSGVVMGGSWGSASRESWRAHSGTWEATVYDWAASGFGAGWWQQVTNGLGAGSIWTASLWAWNDNTQGGIVFTNATRTFYLKLEWYDGASSLLSQSQTNCPLPGELWTRYQLKAIAPPNAAWARLVFGAEGMGSSGSLQFDDASLRGSIPGRTTWYFRRDAFLDGSPQSATFNVRGDDGLAVYVNGVEAFRDGLPSAALNAAVEATNAVYGPAETTYVARAVNPALFTAGRNVIAAEVHQMPTEHPVVSSVWINEIHYDNSGTDTNEGVEVAGAAGTDLAAYRLYFYDGGSGVYRTNILSGVIPDQSNGCGAVWVPVPSMQNGATDGVALVYGAATTVVQFLSYEGVFTAIGGPAAGMLSTDLGVAESSTTPVGQSLQLGGTGVAYAAYTWTGPATASTGRLNAAQAVQPPEARDIAFDLELVTISPVANLARSAGVAAVTAPDNVLAGDRADITVTVSNSGQAVATFTVVLVDTNSGAVVASQTVSNLVAGSIANVVLQWNTFGVTGGTHGLKTYTILNGVTNMAGAVTTPLQVGGSGFALNALGATGSIGGRCTAVAAAGSLLVVGAGGTLEVWDRSSPLSPSRIGTVRLPGVIEAVVVNGGYAYAACGQAGVHFVDLATPTRPAHVNTFDSSGSAHALAVSGTLLYVADGAAGLRILNIANPLSSSLAGAWSTVGPARAVALGPNRAYVLDEYDGLIVLDVSSPAAPSQLGRYAPATAARGLALSDSTALIADDNGTLSLVSVANPAAPSLTSRLSLGAFGESIVATGTVAYVAAGGAGLLTVDISSRANPVVTFTNATPGPAASVSVAGSSAYVAENFTGLQALNLAAPLAPSAAAAQAVGYRGNEIALSGIIACLAAGERGLQVFNMVDPAHPVLLGSLTGIANARCVAIRGSHAIVGDGAAGVRIVDISTPSAPVLVGTFADTNLVFARSVAAAGNRAAATDGRRVVLFDLTTPSSPSRLAVHTSGGFVFDLAMTTTHVFAAAGGDGLVILAVPTLAAVGSYNTPGMAMAVALDGSRVHVADGAGGWAVVDVTSPSAPTLVNSSAAQGPADSVAVTSYLAAHAGSRNVLSTAAAATPLTAVPMSSFEPLVRVMQLAASGPYVFTAEDEAGLGIFNIAPNDQDLDRLPDSWEQQVVDANPSDAITSIAGVLPGDDFDGDGLNNLEEAIAGTVPTDAGSLFAVSTTGSAGSKYVVRWLSVAGKQYSVHKSTNLMNGFSSLAAGLDGTPPVNSYTDTVTSAGATFYMIGVQ